MSGIAISPQEKGCLQDRLRHPPVDGRAVERDRQRDAHAGRDHRDGDGADLRGGLGDLPVSKTANAAGALATTYVLAGNVSAGQFIVTHANAGSADRTFWWVALG